MTEDTALARTERPDAPMEWGKRTEIVALGDRIKAMLPGGDKLNQNEAMALAQYAYVMDLNPFRGEVYAFRGKGGQLCIVDGYKALARWADDKAPYSERFEPITDGELPEGAIGFRCWILRNDRKKDLAEFVRMGAEFRMAYEMVATEAVGVVTADEIRSRTPPTGWTWEQVARKRALKNALNLSHGAPSPREIAALSWKVNGVQTVPADWDGQPEGLQPAERTQLAALNARQREHKAAWDKMTPAEHQEVAKRNRAMLHGTEADDELVEMPPLPDAPEWDEAVFYENEELEPEPSNGDIPRSAKALLIDVNNEVPYYGHVNHLLGAIRIELNQKDWDWDRFTAASDQERANIRRLAISHAAKQAQG